MDIDQIKAKKRETEDVIRREVVAFAEATGLVVEGIGFEMIDMSDIGGKRRMECTAVTMDVRLGE